MLNLLVYPLLKETEKDDTINLLMYPLLKETEKDDVITLPVYPLLTETEEDDVIYLPVYPLLKKTEEDNGLTQNSYCLVHQGLSLLQIMFKNPKKYVIHKNFTYFDRSFFICCLKFILK